MTGLETDLTRLVGVRHPVVQTGMGWVAGPRLVGATANAGALGILASATMTYQELENAIRETRERTTAPFGVNLRADAADAAERIGLIVREGVRVASFALAPKRDMIARLKDAGVVVMPSVGAARHAEKVASWGADAVIVQGGEAGGHTGSVATTLLLPSVVDSVDIPVIAAGGFFDGRGLAAALAYGAAGIAIDGRPHRVLRTELVERLENAGPARGLALAVRNAMRFHNLTGQSWRAMIGEGVSMRKGAELTWSQVIMAANTPMLLRSGLVDGRTDTGVLASGQVVGMLHDLPSCEELITGVVDQAREDLKRLGDMP